VTARTREGRRLDVQARFVVGADGVGSIVARGVDAPVVHRGVGASGVVYGRWADVADDGYEWFYDSGAAAGLIPTNDGEVCAFAAGPPARVRATLAGDAPGGFRRLLDAAAPGLSHRLAAGRPPTTLRTAYGAPGFTRRAWGPGWALVGDAGYWKDPVTAHGMTDALRDAELLAGALVAATRGGDEAGALDGYERERDRLSAGVRDVTDAIARYDWGLADVHRLLLDLSSAMSAEVEALLAFGPTPPAVDVEARVRRPA
jgi:2-polyprenyl-6-methoxyphenol hydroxylase-like FAD-dependent oxidoreductase